MDPLDRWFLFELDREPFEGCLVECPECGEASPIADWPEGEIPCELCGAHTAIVCPSCEEHFDHVDAPIFRVVDPPEGD